MISSIGSGGASSSIVSILAQSSRFGSSSASDALGSSASLGDTADISGPSQLFGKLQDLSKTDPTKFKQLTSSIADNLESAANGASGNAGSFLSDIASKFRNASQTGDASSLKPPSSPPSFDSATYNSFGSKFDLPTSGGSGSNGVDLQSLLKTLESALSDSTKA